MAGKHLGVIGDVSAHGNCVEWNIPDFLSLDALRNQWFESPAFVSGGCTWTLRVYPKSLRANGWTSVLLRRTGPATGVARATFSVGVKRADGNAEGEERGTFEVAESCWVQPVFKRLSELRSRRSELLPGGTLTLRCHVEVETPPSSDPPSPEADTEQLADLEALSADFEDLLGSERQSDVTVHVQGREYRAHRSVLVARSPVLRAMYEHDTEEARTGVLRIPDCDPDSFADFLRYLYTGRTGQMSFRTACHLYATAEKYDVQRLKSFCSERLRRNLAPENVCDVVVLADLHGDEGLSSAAQSFFNDQSARIFLTSEWTDMMKQQPPPRQRTFETNGRCHLEKSLRGPLAFVDCSFLLQ